MLIDCDTCTARGLACDGCIMPALLGASPSDESDQPTPPALDEAEQQALRVLADGAMIPPIPVVAVYEKSAGKAA